MNPLDFLTRVIDPAVALNLVSASQPAMVMLHAIAGQESGWTARIQIPGGAARGYWQCEKAGAVAHVMQAQATNLRAFCIVNDIPFNLTSIFEAIAWHDALALIVARLELYTDPPALPAVGDIDTAWETYLRVWRPGKPSRDRWNQIYPQTLQAFGLLDTLKMPEIV